MKLLKCLVIGSPVCGKTSLINTFMRGFFQGYMPNNVIAHYNVDYVFDEQEFQSDGSSGTSSSECESEFGNDESHYVFRIYDYDVDLPNDAQSLREDELNDINVIILCYQSATDSSIYLLENKFRKLIEARWPSVPVLIAACFADMLNFNLCSTFKQPHAFQFQQQNIISPNYLVIASVKRLLRSLKAKSHIYCSALENLNVSKVFLEAFKHAIYHHREYCLHVQLRNQLENENLEDIVQPTSTQSSDSASLGYSNENDEMNELNDENNLDLSDQDQLKISASDLISVHEPNDWDSKSYEDNFLRNEENRDSPHLEDIFHATSTCDYQSEEVEMLADTDFPEYLHDMTSSIKTEDEIEDNAEETPSSPLVELIEEVPPEQTPIEAALEKEELESFELTKECKSAWSLRNLFIILLFTLLFVYSIFAVTYCSVYRKDCMDLYDLGIEMLDQTYHYLNRSCVHLYESFSHLNITQDWRNLIQ